MTLDRILQRKLLEIIASKYPDPCETSDITEDMYVMSRNLLYLEEHGLVQNMTGRYIGAPTAVLNRPGF